MLQKEIDGVDDVRVARFDLRARFQLDVLLEVAEIDRPTVQIALGLGDRRAEPVLLIDDSHHIGFGGDDDLDLLLHHLLVTVEGHRVEGIDDGDDQLPVADGDGDHPVLAGERTGDLRFDHLHIELQRIDFEEMQMRVFGDQARKQEVVDARAVAAGVGEVHCRERLERARGVLIGAGLGRAGLRADLLVDRVDFGALFFIDESGVEQQAAKVRDSDLATFLVRGNGSDGHIGMINVEC